MPRKSAAASLHFPNLTRIDRLSPPPDLTKDERTVFVDVIAACQAAHFHASDRPLLIVYCRQILLEREAASHLAKQGHVIDGKPNPWAAIHQQASKALLQLSRALKLTPTARKPTASSRAKPQQLSYYERARLENSDGEIDE
jgi:phage terminase small subunit